MLTAILLGAIQGVAEWLPVSSEGLVAAAYSLLRGGGLAEAAAYALWLHAGTGLAAAIALRDQIRRILSDLFHNPRQPANTAVYLAVSLAISLLSALPLLLFLDGMAAAAGPAVMAAVGALTLITGALQLRRPRSVYRRIDDASLADAVMAGLAQGLSVLPGLSRSGLTVAVLLGRGIRHEDALRLSFLMSVPASLTGALFLTITGESAPGIGGADCPGGILPGGAADGQGAAGRGGAGSTSRPLSSPPGS